MTKRKLILIIADVLLLAVFIIQCILNAGDSAKVFEMKDTPDAITIEGEKGNVELVKENGIWIIGDKKYAANESSVDDIIDTISEVRALDKVATASDAQLNRYDLVDGKKITVTAKKEGKEIRKLVIGKEATASSQGYITIDGGKDIYLASGNLRQELNKSVDELRSKVLWNLDKSTITEVSFAPSDGAAWSLSKMGEGDDVVWNISGADVDVDPEKASTYFESLSNISVPVWHNEGENLGGNKIFTAKVTSAFKTYSVDVYEVPAKTDEDKPLYWGTSSETPYTFELAAYTVNKFKKDVMSLGK